MGNAEEPSADIIDLFAFFEGGVETQEDFLDGLLGFRRVNAERQEVAV
jgi:hypothetical protein